MAPSLNQLSKNDLRFIVKKAEEPKEQEAKAEDLIEDDVEEQEIEKDWRDEFK